MWYTKGKEIKSFCLTRQRKDVKYEKVYFKKLRKIDCKNGW